MRLNIEKLVYGGLGLAHDNGTTVFVEQVLPGETAEVKIIGKRGGVPIAYPQEIIENSLFRRKPPCKYYGACGGCDWQHIAYAQQLIFKHDILLDCIKRIGKIGNIPEIEIIPSPEWEYRLRAQLKVNKEKKRIGFYRKKTNDVIAIKKCPLLCPQINTILESQDEIVSVLPRRIKQIKVIAGTNDSITSVPIIKNYSAKKTEIAVGNRVFTVSGSSFFQGNRFLLEKLGTWAEQFVSGQFFVDMYGGLGFFSVMLGEKFHRGLLIENDKKQVDLAKENFIANGMNHINAETVSAETFLLKVPDLMKKPDCLIVDPPRPGLTRQAREGIRDLKPTTILYVSCNPSTQARDVGFFTKKCKYSMKKCALFDLYPQTHHMETVLLLKIC